MTLRKLCSEIWQLVRPRRAVKNPHIIIPRWIAESNKIELERRLLDAGFDLDAENTQITETEYLITYRQDTKLSQEATTTDDSDRRRTD
jgi:hypothetical protein